jgi:hypothetical protein
MSEWLFQVVEKTSRGAHTVRAMVASDIRLQFSLYLLISVLFDFNGLESVGWPSLLMAKIRHVRVLMDLNF